ncbi:hypothetical protein FIBSPDRAFT_897277 [Athelia psychrophila]|uniref:Uncharacterized protein n=1 Tax=Athelia psychrophila TaxID=1759441 RepID=A0A166CG74_9AGAM|nr:hypothetical protein FIBSPDRAFT_897277 [Fibularhizoctonia sp. CBS 109695]
MGAQISSGGSKRRRRKKKEKEKGAGDEERRLRGSDHVADSLASAAQASAQLVGSWGQCTALTWGAREWGLSERGWVTMHGLGVRAAPVWATRVGCAVRTWAAGTWSCTSVVVVRGRLGVCGCVDVVLAPASEHEVVRCAHNMKWYATRVWGVAGDTDSGVYASVWAGAGLGGRWALCAYRAGDVWWERGHGGLKMVQKCGRWQAGDSLACVRGRAGCGVVWYIRGQRASAGGRHSHGARYGTSAGDGHLRAAGIHMAQEEHMFARRERSRLDEEGQSCLHKIEQP